MSKTSRTSGKTSRTFRIPCFMFDRCERLRPSAFMDIAQEIAAIGSEEAGFSDADLRKNGLVWILARMQASFERLPQRYDSPCTVETWHRGFDGLLFTREYRLLAADGSVCVNANSSWLLMDTATRRIVRGERLEGALDVTPQCADAAIESTCPKLVMPSASLQPQSSGAVQAESSGAVRAQSSGAVRAQYFGCDSVQPSSYMVEDIGSRKVLYSDVDYNGHANNARYTQWAYDLLPEEFSYGREIRKVLINFNHEAHPGQTVLFRRCRVGDSFYVEGLSEDGLQVFISRFEF